MKVRLILLPPPVYARPVVDRMPGGLTLHETGATLQMPAREEPRQDRRAATEESPAVERNETETPHKERPCKQRRIVAW